MNAPFGGRLRFWIRPADTQDGERHLDCCEDASRSAPIDRKPGVSKLTEHGQRVAIFGWHYTNGQPIQPLYTGHVDWYVDYSHGIRPVRRWMRIDGTLQPFEKILKDSVERDVLSDEGEITVSRYDK